MSMFARLRDRLSRLQAPAIPLRRLPQPDEAHLRSTWRQAKASRIERALALSQQRNPGGWYVVGASTDIGRRTSVVRRVGGVEVVLWRDSTGTLVAGPGECPHLGASLAGGVVHGDELYCRWHGLEVPAHGNRLWQPFDSHDDGVLVWARLNTQGEARLPRPVIAERPPLERSVAAVVAIPGTCEPRDIVANRLDPWHGAWFHPYAFSHLSVDDDASTDEALVVDVAFRLNRTWGVPVRARFTCPDARTIVMHIVEGEGSGSVVETHATPLGRDALGRPRTMMVEATIAFSERSGFQAARAASPLIRTLMRRTARQLWVDDLAYAERRCELRGRSTG